MPKQIQIPGTEATSVKAIEKAADFYVAARETFQTASEKIEEAKTKLLDACHDNLDSMNVDGDGNRVYRYDNLLIVLSSREKLNVKTSQEEEED